jgi:monovalent cation/proton antiporter MnhG/PhaG subunit
MGIVRGVLGGGLLIVGLGLTTIGLYGVLRGRDVFSQLHAAGLATGPGVLVVLLASVATGRASIITHALLVFAFVLLTTPLSSHATARAAYRLRTRRGRVRDEAMMDEPDPPEG